MKISVVCVAMSVCLGLGCASEDRASEPTGDKTGGKQVETKAQAQVEAAVVVAEAIPEKAPPAPTMGAHLDGTDTDYRPRNYRPTARDGKTIELFLRSSPPGASASMDGKAMGITPTFWSGIADGQSHEFTFVKAGYAMARYRFVATQNGVVHGTLKPLVTAPKAKEGSEPAPPPVAVE